MANFKYIKMPMGHYKKFIKINHLSNYALSRLSKGKFTWDEHIVLRDFKFRGIEEAMKQAKEILHKRGLI